jgi:hypothetical protein
VIKFAGTAVAVFGGVAIVHFFLSFFGLALALRVAFDAKRPGGPKLLDVALVRVAEVLLAPLSFANRVVPLQTPSGHLEIAATSVLFGGVAVAVLWLWRRRGHAERPHRPA